MERVTGAGRAGGREVDDACALAPPRTSRSLTMSLEFACTDAVRKQAEQTLEQMLNENPVRQLPTPHPRSILRSHRACSCSRLAFSSRLAGCSQTMRRTQ
jgi:hypothetical protein